MPESADFERLKQSDLRLLEIAKGLVMTRQP